MESGDCKTDLAYVLGLKLISNPFTSENVDEMKLGNYTIKKSLVYKGTGSLLYDIPFLDSRIKKNDNVTIYIITNIDTSEFIEEVIEEHEKLLDDMGGGIQQVYINGNINIPSYIIIEDHENSVIDSIHDFHLSNEDIRIMKQLDCLHRIEIAEETFLTEQKRTPLQSELFRLKSKVKEYEAKTNSFLQNSLSSDFTLLNRVIRGLHYDFEAETNKFQNRLDDNLESHKQAKKEYDDYKETYEKYSNEIDISISEINDKLDNVHANRTAEFLQSCPILLKCYKTKRLSQIEGLALSPRPDLSFLDSLAERQSEIDRKEDEKWNPNNIEKY